MYTHCTITCIRTKNEEYNDDVITIKPLLVSDSGTEYHLQYVVSHKVGRDYSVKDVRQKSVNSMDRDTLLSYIDTLFDSLYYDEDPFEVIQFDIPSFPSTLIRASNLDLVRERILSHFKLITQSAVSWALDTSTRHLKTVPTSKSKNDERTTKVKQAHEYTPTPCCTENTYSPPRTPGTRQHLFFDKDGTIAECNNEYCEY